MINRRVYQRRSPLSRAISRSTPQHCIGKTCSMDDCLEATVQPPSLSVSCCMFHGCSSCCPVAAAASTTNDATKEMQEYVLCIPPCHSDLLTIVYIYDECSFFYLISTYCTVLIVHNIHSTNLASPHLPLSVAKLC